MEEKQCGYVGCRGMKERRYGNVEEKRRSGMERRGGAEER